MSSSQRRARRIPDETWENWHEEIVRLYVEEDTPRKDIVDIMRRQHSLVIT